MNTEAVRFEQRVVCFKEIEIVQAHQIGYGNIASQTRTRLSFPNPLNDTSSHLKGSLQYVGGGCVRTAGDDYQLALILLARTKSSNHVSKLHWNNSKYQYVDIERSMDP